MPRAKASGSANADRRVERRRRQEAPVNPADELERGREAYARRAWRDAYGVAVARRSGGPAGRGGPRAAGDVGLHARPRRRVPERPGARPSCLPGRAAKRCALCAARSGWASISSLRGEMGRASGWLGRAQRLLEREEQRLRRAAATCCCRSMFQHEAAGDYEAAVADRGRRPPRSASASAMRTCSPSPCTRRASCWSSRGGSRRGSGCWTRRWWRSPRASCRRSSAAWSIAA